MSNIKAFLFDLDGTLVDTESYYRKCWPIVMKTMGYVMTDDLYLPIRELGRPYLDEYMFKNFSKDLDIGVLLKKTYEVFNNISKEKKPSIKLGAKELLEFLNKKNIICAIVTSTYIDVAKKVCEDYGISQYVKEVISGANLEFGKPNKLVYEYALKELNLSSNECITIEDAPNGIKSSHDAGIKTIMVPDQTEATEKDKKNTIAILKNLIEVKEYIVENNYI